MESEYDFPVFGTQGGGLVREVGRNQYIFVEAPPAGMGLGIGDHMPEQWSIIAANDAAVRMIDEEQEEVYTGDERCSFNLEETLEDCLKLFNRNK